MIWHKKNGHSKKNLLTGVVLSLIFSALFSFFGFTLSCSAVSVQGIDSFIRFTNSSNQSMGNTFYETPALPINGSIDNVIVPSSGAINTSKSMTFNRNFSPFGYHIYLAPTAITDNWASLSLEFNVVTSYESIIENREAWSYVQLGLDDLNVVTCAVNDAYTPRILTQEVSYSITPWSTTRMIGNTLHYYTNSTLTLYVNLALADLQLSDSASISCEIRSNQYTLMNMSSTVSLWYEKMGGFLEFVHGPNDAIASSQLNVANLQLQLQQLQAERDLQDRQNIESRSGDSEEAGQNASSSAQNATSSLLGAITSIYGVLLNPTVTDCRIGPVNIYELDLGTLDFCQAPYGALPGVNAIGALLMVGLVILLAWSVLKAGLGLYKDLFGGK